MVNSYPRLPKVMPDVMSIRVSDLVVSLTAAAVAIVRTAKLHQPCDVDSWTDRIIRAEHCPPVGNLKTEVAHRLGVECRGQRSHHGVVLSEAAAAPAGIGPAGRVERVPCFAVVRKRVPQHDGVAGELMIDLAGSLSFDSRGGEEI